MSRVPSRALWAGGMYALLGLGFGLFLEDYNKVPTAFLPVAAALYLGISGYRRARNEQEPEA